jgi:hypothetical protein
MMLRDKAESSKLKVQDIGPKVQGLRCRLTVHAVRRKAEDREQKTEKNLGISNPV